MLNKKILITLGFVFMFFALIDRLDNNKEGFHMFYIIGAVTLSIGVSIDNKKS